MYFAKKMFARQMEIALRDVQQHYPRFFNPWKEREFWKPAEKGFGKDNNDWI